MAWRQLVGVNGKNKACEALPQILKKAQRPKNLKPELSLSLKKH